MIKKDTIIISSAGNYSDYSIDGLYIAQEDFDFDIWMTKFQKENPLKEHKYKWGTGLVWDDPDIAGFFVANGLLKRIPYQEMHINAYSYEVKPESVQLIEND